MRKTIGVLGYWAGYNYGSECTNYATYKFLIDSGYTVKMFDIAIAPTKTIFKQPPYFRTNPYAPNTLFGRYKDKKELKEINNLADLFITTSDQQLAYGVYKMTGETATLDFIKKNKKTIAYAASFGFDKFYGPESSRATMSHFLKEIDFFSSREESGVKLAKDIFGVDSIWVLDPVFLIEPGIWSNIAEGGKYKNNHTLFNYILDFNDEKNQFIHTYSSNNNYSPITITDAHKDFFNLKSNTNLAIEKGASVEDWLSAIRDSDFYITDSFHGVCFAIIFQKQFVVFTNHRGKTRLESILKKFGLENRLVDTEKEAIELLKNGTLINYDSVNKILKREKEKSSQWLINAIETELEVKSYTTYDILDEKIDNVPVLQFNNIKMLINRHFIYKHYYIYKILSKILIGQKRKHYTLKAKVLHEKVRDIRNLEKQWNLDIIRETRVAVERERERERVIPLLDFKKLNFQKAA